MAMDQSEGPAIPPQSGKTILKLVEEELTDKDLLESSSAKLSKDLCRRIISRSAAIPLEVPLRYPQSLNDIENALVALEVFPPDDEVVNTKSGQKRQATEADGDRAKRFRRDADLVLSSIDHKTAKAVLLQERLSQHDNPFIELCEHGTRQICHNILQRSATSPASFRPCPKVHFVPIQTDHTDFRLGDCSYLNTCYRMDTCKYVHYQLEEPNEVQDVVRNGWGRKGGMEGKQGLVKQLPPQWIEFDIRSLDFSVLGKFSVIVADCPWDIHQTLPYGTLTDDEIKALRIPALQDDGGLLFLWVTGRAMELGRECLEHWGYERIDEMIWLKTSQLQRLIRTGRTGHWLNHSKEHCLVAYKRPLNPPNPATLPFGTTLRDHTTQWVNRGIDVDVVVAETRETSRKPDEVYGLIERLCPGGRKIELFGRKHNTRPGWLTIGNQLGNSDQVFEADLVERFNARYPERCIQLSQQP